MTTFIAACPIGVFAFDEGGKLRARVLFSRSAEEAAVSLEEALSERISKAEEALLDQLKTQAAEKIVFEVRKSTAAHQFPNPAGQMLRDDLEKIAAEAGWKKEELRHFVVSLNTEMTKKKMKTSVGEDVMLINAAGAIGEVEETINLLVMRLREWYGWYWPELSERYVDNEKFVAALADWPERKEKSIGADLKQEDLKEIRTFGATLAGLFDERRALQDYIELRAKAVMPNTSAVAGAMLAAKLLTHAGSLERLAKMPSSTIQIIGAEKALFRFLRGKGKAPKHGLLFTHSLLQGVAKENKGKAARLLAAKISLAARIDFFRGEFIGDKMRADLEKEFARIRGQAGGGVQS